MTTLAEMADAVLRTADARQKTALSRRHAATGSPRARPG
jgi:hypothetical protein